MKIDNVRILIVIIAITLLLFPVVRFSSGVTTIVLGLILVLFSPGYALLSAVFPRQSQLGGIERVGLSLGLSIAIVPLIGLIMHYTNIGLSLYPCLILITIFILANSVVYWYRQRLLSPSERLGITISLAWINYRALGKIDKILYIGLLAVVLASFGILGYLIASPQQGEKFTEFYILNTEGNSENYPKRITQGEPVELMVGIINHEYEEISYRISIRVSGTEYKEIKTEPLTHEQKWEDVVSFIPQILDKTGKVEFWLYKNDESNPYFEEPLHLYIDVANQY